LAQWTWLTGLSRDIADALYVYTNLLTVAYGFAIFGNVFLPFGVVFVCDIFVGLK